MHKLDELLAAGKFAELRQILRDMNPVDIANELGEMDTADLIFLAERTFSLRWAPSFSLMMTAARFATVSM